jgi:hypothetical protein
VEVSVQSLVASEVLAAVVRSHDRTLVLTGRGDVVADDTLAYENNGIDWLSLPPTGRAVFLATDGRAERVMRTSDDPGADVLVPLRVGSHVARTQSVSTASLAALGGALSVPVPPIALTTSRASVTVGLPSGVHPVAVLGGDEPWLALHAMDGVALAVSIAIAVAGLRGRGRRVLGAVALGGLWLISPLAWKALVVAGVVTLAAWLAARLLPRGLRIAAWSAAAAGALVLGVLGSRSAPEAGGWMQEDQDHRIGVRATPAPMDLPEPPAAPPAVIAPSQAAGKEESKDEQAIVTEAITGELEGYHARLALGGVAQGVAPVALTLPAYARSVVASRELVTRERPFSATVVYVTSAGLAPLVAAWIACLALLAWAQRTVLARTVRGVRERLARRSNPDPAPAAPPAPPPVVA